jgi:uncharacterized protein
LDAVYGLRWPDGWGVLGKVLERHPDGAVTRELTVKAGSAPVPGALVTLDTRVYQGDPQEALGISFEEVQISGELGIYPAWHIPGDPSAWVILVHGNAMTRRDSLRFLPALVESGVSVLVPSYRNDEVAPRNDDGELTYGKEEWRDLEAAVAFALARGAESIAIEGLSMGGAVVSAFLLESPLAGQVAGVILDSPVLDFERSVEHQAADENLPLVPLPLPPTLVTTAEWWASIRFGIDWDDTRYLERANEFHVPMLIIHGTADDTVPVATSKELTTLRPDLVMDAYFVEDAGHVASWNLRPEEYERRLLAFLQAISLIPSSE